MAEGLSLASEFTVPPFSILDARKGDWAMRKKRWIALGIESELGREGSLAYSASCQSAAVYRAREEYETKVGRKVSMKEFLAANPGQYRHTGTSVFDPVLAELMVSWFSAPDDVVLDPFAGGSVRGVVASMLGRDYVGVELRAEQVAANRAQGIRICGDRQPAWICGDSLKELDGVPNGLDMILTCPPYGSLEVYSRDPRDLSQMRAHEFDAAYSAILQKAVGCIADDRFAVIVVGNYRDSKTGTLRDLRALTVAAMVNAGAALYNEAILLTSVGSLAMRARNQMRATRKLGRCHQEVLIFVKGDPKRATTRLGQTVPYEFPKGRLGTSSSDDLGL